MLAAGLGAACSTGEVQAADLAASVHSLPVLLERATLVPPADWRGLEALPGAETIELVDLSRGRAVLRVALDESAAVRKLSAEGVHVSLPVPFPAAGDSEATRAAPHLEVLAQSAPNDDPVIVDVITQSTFAEPLRDPAKLPAPLERPMIWLDRGNLHAYGEKNGAAGAELSLTYGTHAARLAGFQGELGLIDATPADFLLGRYEESEAADGADTTTSVSAMWLEAGTRLEFDLHDFAGGVLTGALAIEPGSIESASPFDPKAVGLELIVEFPGGNKTLQLASLAHGQVALPLPANAPGVRATLVAHGPPGALLRVDQARLEDTSAAPRPNVLLVIADTLRADRMDSFGGTEGLMPNLDALSDESLRFTEYWATSCWTLPTISTMLTSVHAETHGGMAKDTPVAPDIETLASVLRDAGYRTEAITEGGLFRSLYNLDRGFERFVEHHDGLARGVKLAHDFLDERGDDEPWFLTLHSYEVHEPYTPNPALVAAVRAKLPAEIAADITRPTDFVGLYEEGRWDAVLDAEVPALMEELHDAEVRATDELLGGLFDRLRSEGHLDDTLIVFTADHGEEFGEHGMLGHSDALYPELLHIPLMLRFPDGYRAGEVDARPTSQLHMTPTVLDAVGLHSRALESAFQGASLLREPGEEPVYAWRHRADGESLWALRQGDLLLIEGTYAFDRGEDGVPGVELFDLATDPGATRDLDTERPTELAELRQRLAAHRAELQDSGAPRRSVYMDASTKQNLGDLGYL